MHSSNDNEPVAPASRPISMVGRVLRDGRVAFADEQGADADQSAPYFPNDPREA